MLISINRLKWISLFQQYFEVFVVSCVFFALAQWNLRLRAHYLSLKPVTVTSCDLG